MWNLSILFRFILGAAVLTAASCADHDANRGAATPGVVHDANRPATAPDVERAPRTLTISAPRAADLSTDCNVVRPQLAAPIELKRTFYDDFHDFNPERTRWTLHYERPNNPGAAHTHDFTDEQQIFTDPSYPGTADRPLGLNPFRIENDHLSIVARKIDENLLPFVYGRRYFSGLLQSHEFFSQLYGYFEASIQIPAGQGFWPGFWLVPEDGPTPPELDILEALGDHADVIYSTVHWNYKDPKGTLVCKRVIPDSATRSVIYGVLWTPEIIVYYTDRVPVLAIRTPPMPRAMYFIFDLNVGGQWPGKISDRTPAEGRMAIDWVAAYSYDRP